MSKPVSWATVPLQRNRQTAGKPQHKALSTPNRVPEWVPERFRKRTAGNISGQGRKGRRESIFLLPAPPPSQPAQPRARHSLSGAPRNPGNLASVGENSRSGLALPPAGGSAPAKPGESGLGWWELAQWLGAAARRWLGPRKTRGIWPRLVGPGPREGVPAPGRRHKELQICVLLPFPLIPDQLRKRPFASAVYVHYFANRCGIRRPLLGSRGKKALCNAVYVHYFANRCGISWFLLTSQRRFRQRGVQSSARKASSG